MEETNQNAEQCIQTKPDPSWYETTCEEMHAFVVLHVLFGCKVLPETRFYWSKDPLLGVPTVQKIVPRNHFEKIRQYLHLNNRDNMLLRKDPNHDKLFKVRPLLDVVTATFRQEYLKLKFRLVNEGMVTYKTDLALNNICLQNL